MPGAGRPAAEISEAGNPADVTPAAGNSADGTPAAGSRLATVSQPLRKALPQSSRAGMPSGSRVRALYQAAPAASALAAGPPNR